MNLLFFLLLEDQPSLSNVCPALHGRKVKGFERAGAPKVPRSGLEDGAKICTGPGYVYGLSMVNGPKTNVCVG